MPATTLSELQAALSARMEADAPHLSPVERAAYVDATLLALTAADPTAVQKRRIDDDLLRSDVAYAIPDDALNMYPALVQAAIGAFSKGPIGALSDLVGVLFRYRTLRVELTAEEAAVLRALRAAKTARVPPLAPADINKRLLDAGLTLKRPVADVLATLKGKKTDKATLVVESDGRWAIGNV